jgi:hypothetical protein
MGRMDEGATFELERFEWAARLLATVMAKAPHRMLRISVVALAVAGSIAAPAFAANPSPTPSGKNLRQAYPLRAKPSATPPSVAGVPAPRRTPDAARASNGYVTVRVVIVLAVTFGALLALLIVRRRRRDGPELSRDERDAQAGPAPPMPPLSIFKNARDTRPRARGRFVGAFPPDRAKAWSAEIVWRDSRFVVAGRSEGDEDAVVLISDRVAWPPRGAEEVAALEQVVSELAATVCRAGWSELERGEAWYARRFSWVPRPDGDPVAAPSSSQEVGNG